MHEIEILRMGTKGGLPTISDYADALTNPDGRFRTLHRVEPRTDARGEVVFFAGNNAAVFPVCTAHGPTTLKCYIKKGLHVREVYNHLSRIQDPLLTPARLLENELFVHGVFGDDGWHDITASEWVTGVTLETAIRRASRKDGFTFGELSEAFERMALELLAREWAHGDLKPENIIVRPDGSLCLIDYDAMFVPALAGQHTLEVGTPPFQHPARDHTLFDKSLDDYPIAIIAASLRALALEPDIYKRHNRSDNIIFYPADILAGRSEAYDEMLRLFANRGEHDSYNLALSLNRPSPCIPGLAEMLTLGSSYPLAERKPPRVADVRATYMVSYPEPCQEGSLWGYCDDTGHKVIPPIYTTAHAFSEGLAVVCIHRRWQAIDPAGRAVLDFDGYSEVKPFFGGLAAACTVGGLWGYLTREGVAAIRPRYEMAGIFHEGLALVRFGGLYGYIDRTGQWVIQPTYNYATGFRNGRATVQSEGKTFEIGLYGEKL